MFLLCFIGSTKDFFGFHLYSFILLRLYSLAIVVSFSILCWFCIAVQSFCLVVLNRYVCVFCNRTNDLWSRTMIYHTKALMYLLKNLNLRCKAIDSFSETSSKQEHRKRAIKTHENHPGSPRGNHQTANMWKSATTAWRLSELSENHFLYPGGFDQTHHRAWVCANLLSFGLSLDFFWVALSSLQTNC